MSNSDIIAISVIILITVCGIAYCFWHERMIDLKSEPTNNTMSDISPCWANPERYSDSPVVDLPLSGNCPNCGAPIRKNKCEYCGTIAHGQLYIPT